MHPPPRQLVTRKRFGILTVLKLLLLKLMVVNGVSLMLMPCVRLT